MWGGFVLGMANLFTYNLLVFFVLFEVCNKLNQKHETINQSLVVYITEDLRYRK